MTNEECVKILRQVKDGDLLTFDKDRRKALDMAIEMMSNSQTQMSRISDPISRQAAIDAIVNRTVTVDTDDQWLSGHAQCELEIIDIINALPSAQPRYRKENHLSTEEKIADFQNGLKAEREAEGLTGAQLGKIAGLTRQSIWNLENNKVKMTKAQYIAFQVALRYLLGKGADMEWLSTIIDE